MPSEVFSSDSLSYSGRLVNTNGSPVTGPVNLKFDFAYTNATASVLCTQQISSVALTNGVFHVKLDPDCTPSSWVNVLSLVPAGEALAIRVTDETHTKAYSFQALHSMPLSTMSQMSKQLAQLGATPGQILAWDGTKWAPTNESGTGNGSVTSVATGTGLTGGPITASGTISIANGGVDTTQLADGAVTDQKVASGIARNKLANGTASHVLVNDGAGVISSVAQLPITQGGTGAANAAGARTNLGLGTAAVVDLGTGVGRAMPSDSVPVCFAFEKLQMTAGPAFAWACVPDNDSADNTKLPLDGSAPMAGTLDMNGNRIIDLPTPSADGDAATKLYVDSQVGGVNASQWTTNGSNIHYNSGNVGIGTATPQSMLNTVNGNSDIRLSTGAGGNTPTMSVINTNATGKASGLYSGTSYSGFLFSTDNSGFFSIGGSAKSKFLSNTVADGTETYFMTILGNGNVGIGTTSPTHKFEVAGDSAVNGKVKFKSDNANYVELQAPASLAATLNFKLPGTAGAAGNALVTDGSGNLSWAAVATGASAVGGDLTGTITNAQLGSGVVTDAEVAAGAAIAQSKIANLTTDLAAKEPTIAAGTTAQYWRGDKSWQTLNTTAVAEGTNLYFTEPRVLGTDLAGFVSGAGTITAADTVLSAIQKLDGSLNNAITSANTDFVNVTGDTMTGPLVLAADPTVALGAATKQYVDAQITSTSYWTKTGSDLGYTAGKVGIGDLTPSNKFVVSFDGVSAGFGFGEGLGMYSNINANVDASLLIGHNLNFKDFSANRNTLVRSVTHSTLSGGALLFGGNSANVNGVLENDFGIFTAPSAAVTTNTNFTPAPRLVVKAAGNVGIGTTSPMGKLDVVGGRVIGGTGVNQHATTGMSTTVGMEARAAAADPAPSMVWHHDGVFTMYIQSQASPRALRVTSPSGEAATNFYVDGNVAVKSDNANYVVMRAPASLAATLNLTWPGTAGASGNALTTDGAGNLSWTAVATTATTVGGDLTGTIANAQIAAGAIVDADVAAGAAIAQSKIANLTTDLAAKEPTITAGTTAQYWRGDKSWQTLNTTAVPEGTNLYFLDSRVRAALMSGYAVGTAVPLAATDTLIEALGKLEAQIIANDTAFDNSGVWTKSGSNVNYTAGKVSVGSTTTSQAVMNIGGSISGTTRTWMNYGITFGAAADSDGGYVGLKDEGTNRQDMVVAWGDDVGDNLRFIHTRSGGAAEGDEYMRISGAGNVGIGTASPTYKFQVQKTAVATPAIMIGGGFSGGPRIQTYGLDADANAWMGLGTDMAGTTYEHSLYYPVGPSSEGKLTMGTYNGTTYSEKVRVTSAGNMGVGTTNPLFKFHVGEGSIFSSHAASDTGVYIGAHSSGYGIVQASNAPNTAAKNLVLQQYGGNVGVGIVAPGVPLDVAGDIRTTGKYSFVDNPGGGGGDAAFMRYYAVAGEQTRLELSVQNDANDHMHFIGGHFNFMPNSLGSGYMGIGTETPRVKLDVIGKASFGNYNIVAPTNIGAYNIEVGGVAPNATNGEATILFHDQGDYAHQLRYTANNLYFEGAYNGYGTTATPNFHVGGNAYATAFLYTSDKRLKKDFTEIKNPVETINKLHGVNFTWKETNKKDVGFIAQEVEKVVPALVDTNKETGKKSVQYGNIVAILVEAFKKHFDQTEKENQKLKREIASLKEENAKMNARLDNIEKQLAKPKK